MAERKIDSFNDFRSEEKPPALEVPAWCAPNIADLARRAVERAYRPTSHHTT